MTARMFPQHGDETELERLLRIGLCLGRAVGEGGVDGARKVRRPGRIGQLGHVPADLPEIAQPLVDVLPREEEKVGIEVRRTRASNAADGEVPVSRKDRSLEGDPVARLEPILGGQPLADDTGGALAAERLFLLRREQVLRVHLQVAVRVHRELREEMALVDVDPAEPGAERDGADPGDLRQPVLVGERQEDGGRAAGSD